ncbi:hypothetical protein [Nereida sp. MMG025]|nr:hypothetical protein [Nereida sp. MMG025]
MRFETYGTCKTRRAAMLFDNGPVVRLRQYLYSDTGAARRGFDQS